MAVAEIESLHSHNQELYPQEVAGYMELLEEYSQDPRYNADPAFTPLANQVHNHLEHVTYDFRIADDSNDYPYKLRHTEAFPVEPTEVALAKAERLINLAVGDVDIAALEIELTEDYKREAQHEQDATVQNLLNSPLEVYDEFTARRREGGNEASFPEFGWTLKGLFYDMVKKPEVREACEKSPLLSSLRNLLLGDIQTKINEGTFGYKSTIRMIEDATAFFDIVVRTLEPDAPVAYHSARFEYNFHAALEDPELTLLPSMGSVTSADLLKIRGVPVGLIGVSTDTLTVDGFPQTPYEFFMHDVDHTRRMHEETLLAIEREGVEPRKYYEDATQLIHQVLMPAYDLEGITDPTERDLRIAMRMVIFEILHEDGYDPSRDAIAEAILREPMEHTPFERVVNGRTVEYFTSPRATMLAHVYRKLAHTFYDLPEKRSTSLGTDFARTRVAIAEGAARLYQLVTEDLDDFETVRATCQELVSTDEGFTDAFLGNIAHDIRRRGVGRKALSMMITRPLRVHEAVRQARSFKPQLHSLFGYSGFEYEDPEALQAAIGQHLRTLNPEETAIAIGATPYGIGKMYPIAKDLGFTTLGIVASLAVARNEECAEGVDELIVVKDKGWGGYKYSEANKGLLSPTTRVFAGASDSIAAFGGNGITDVTLREMHRRGKSISYQPFEMHHRTAQMLYAQKGLPIERIDYRGAGYQAAKDLGLLATAK